MGKNTCKASDLSDDSRALGEKPQAGETSEPIKRMAGGVTCKRQILAVLLAMPRNETGAQATAQHPPTSPAGITFRASSTSLSAWLAPEKGFRCFWRPSCSDMLELKARKGNEPQLLARKLWHYH
ncbi:metal transporter CNNM1 [Platysternon megacephalum]|uniref:Metal transporter CNNM1 n=1 Tax=Platysternon megacephalum TaxID=55544 RepID=A0A4D9DX43_9SAUR|nr:metal transporter CNNM1 [Platysternon megacephalum]